MSDAKVRDIFAIAAVKFDYVLYVYVFHAHLLGEISRDERELRHLKNNKKNSEF